MGREIVYCTVCGDRISPADFDRGGAATVLARHYCAGCSDDVIQKTPGRPKGTTAVGFSRKAALRRAAWAAGADSGLPYLIAGAISLTALLLLVYVIWGATGPGHP